MRRALMLVAVLVLGVLAGRQTVRVPERVITHAPAEPVVTPQPQKHPAEQTAPSPERSQPLREKRFVPLGQIYSTSIQVGLKPLPSRGDEETAADIRNISKRCREAPSPLAFLVPAVTIEKALQDTNKAFMEGLDVSQTTSGEIRDDSGGVFFKEPFWVVVSLGSHCLTPEPYWVINEVTVSDNEVVVSYSPIRGGTLTANSVGGPFCYWIPIGNRPPGELVVRLKDVGHEVESLVTRVRIR